MKLLRIGISDDVFGPLRDEERSWHIVQERLAAAFGEPVETVLKSAWPNDAYPDVIERWVEREQPDAVFLAVASYWVSFPSAPLRLQRSRLAGLPLIGRLGLRASGNPVIAHNAAFRALRRAAFSSVGYAYHFEPAECAARVEEAARRILRHEDIALGIRGPMPLGIPLPPRIAAESRARLADFERRVRGICERLHVAYQPPGPGEPPSRSELQADLTHVNARGHARRAEHEYRLMLRALEAVRGPAGK
ncbi:MAG: hypothetical protein KatS3mg064_1970 [Tepidiforma sp.]|nr:hypothetical protein [Tepidiforma sp.]GIW18813.1 MAG: hypothetical protein KatS3mg064_1970 [Tepidiforma sp.]